MSNHALAVAALTKEGAREEPALLQKDKAFAARYLERTKSRLQASNPRELHIAGFTSQMGGVPVRQRVHLLSKAGFSQVKIRALQVVSDSLSVFTRKPADFRVSSQLNGRYGPS